MVSCTKVWPQGGLGSFPYREAMFNVDSLTVGSFFVVLIGTTSVVSKAADRLSQSFGLSIPAISIGVSALSVGLLFSAAAAYAMSRRG